MINKLTWKSEKEMQEELKERIDSRKPNQSRDGYIMFAEGKFVYKGITYLIKVFRHYNHTNKFTSIGRDRISDSHAVVECPEETKPILDLIPDEFELEFLYHDTLHYWNDKQTIEEQIESCHKWAKEDINNLLSGEISKRIDEDVKRLQEAMKNLSDYHDCEKCHDKIVCTSIDKLGNIHCAYCGEIVKYPKLSERGFEIEKLKYEELNK